MKYKNISNADDKIRISFELQSANVPFTIYNARWINCDSVVEPIEPFSLIAQTSEVTGKSTIWNISLDFPFSATFDDNDVLILNTDKGIVRCPTSRAGELNESIDIIRRDYESQLDTSNKKSRNAWLVLYDPNARMLRRIVLSKKFLFVGLRPIESRRRVIALRRLCISPEFEHSRRRCLTI